MTSRDSAWQGIANPVAVDLLRLDEAVQLLLRRSGDPDEQAAARLAEALGRLPLALEQAAAYAARRRLPLARYLELFDQQRAELLALGKPLAYEGTVDATFTLALDQLREINSASMRLLELCALLAPDEIPLPLLLDDPALLPEPLAAAIADPLQRSEVPGALYQMSLLIGDVANTARMHRLIQVVTLAHLSKADRQQRTAEAVELFAKLFPDQAHEPARWQRCSQLLPHAQALIVHARTLKLASTALALLLTDTGIYLSSRGVDVQLAAELHEEALVMRQRLYDGDHPDVATSLSNLAVDMTALNEPQWARELDEQALAMRQRLYDGDHRAVAASLDNLAVDLYQLEEYERALDLHEQALAMFQRLYGESDAPDLAVSLYHLADDLRQLGEFERARELHEHALAMLQRIYRDDDPNVAENLLSLAIHLHAFGDHEQAKELEEQSHAMFQRLAKRRAVRDK